MRTATFTHRHPADTPERRAGADQRLSLAWIIQTGSNKEASGCV
jgi:hypothetical protein